MVAPGAPALEARVADRRYWTVFLLRAVVALAVALVITFNADHSAAVGYLAFGSFCVLSAVAAVFGARRLARGTPRAFFTAQGVLGVVAGTVALVTMTADVAFLLFIVGAWAAVSGALELYVGIRSRRSITQWRDWQFAGAVTMVFSIVAFLIPANLSQVFIGPDGVERSLSASVVLVGALGAYAAIIGVYLSIAAFSLKWDSQRSPTSSTGRPA